MKAITFTHQGITWHGFRDAYNRPMVSRRIPGRAPICVAASATLPGTGPFADFPEVAWHALFCAHRNARGFQAEVSNMILGLGGQAQ